MSKPLLPNLKWVTLALICVSLNVVGTFRQVSVAAHPFLRLQDETVGIQLQDEQGNRLDEVEVWHQNGLLARQLQPVDGVADVVPEGILVAVKAGYQPSGIVLAEIDQTQPFPLILKATGNAGRELSSLPFPVSQESAIELRAAVAEAFGGSLSDHLNDPGVIQFFAQALAFADPALLETMLDENQFRPAPVEQMVQRSLIEAYARQGNATRALEIVESTDETTFKAMGLIALLSQLPQDSQNLATVQTSMLRTINQLKIPGFRLAFAGSLAQHFRKTDQQRQCTELIKRYLPEVEKLPTGGIDGFARVEFAKAVVVEQPQMAIDLIENVDPREKKRALAKLALELAKSDAAMSAKLVQQIRDDTTNLVVVDQPEICFRIAQQEPIIAIELIEGIDDLSARCWSRGLVALAIMDAHPNQASELLEKSFAELEQTSLPAGFERSQLPATMAALLPIVEQVAPQQVEPYLWRTVLFAMPKTRWGGREEKLLQLYCAATGIAQYDPQIARAMVPESKIQPIGMSDRWLAFLAAAWPEKLIASTVEIAELKLPSSRPPTNTLVELLHQPDAKSWQAINYPTNFSWPEAAFTKQDH